MKCVKKITLTKSLIIIFILSIVITAIIGFFTFKHITKYAENTVSKDVILSQIEDKTVEEKMENLFGIIGTRLIFIIGTSIIVGSLLLTFTGNLIIKPIRQMSEATKKVSKGDFDIELKTLRNDEIGELVDSFNKMVKELGKLEYLRKDFITNVSHEFKTPITAIDGYVELLDDDNLSNEERKEYINIIKEETKRLSNLTTNTLRLSKLENQEKQQNKEEYSLDEQIRKCIVLLQKAWEEKNIKFNLKLSSVKINAEKEIVEQIWINIISNAIKFSENNGKISISLEKKNDISIIKIKDNGPGIEKEKIDRIFEKFYQADKSHSQEGNGLGLAITNRIIHLCNRRN